MYNADSTIAEAVPQWLELRKPFVAKYTWIGDREHAKAIVAFLGSKHLKEIAISDVRDYQRMRLAKGMGASAINHEVGCLALILKECDLWFPIKAKYKPLPLPKTIGVALTEAEAKRLLDAAKKPQELNSRTVVQGISIKPRWEVAWCATVLSLNCGAGPGEIRHLQIRDIDLGNRTICIRRGIKNKYRERVLDLNDEAFDAVKRLHERHLRLLGSYNVESRPDYYLIPRRARKGDGDCIFTEPIGSWKKAWDQMRKAIGMPKLRRYDCRHTCITNLYEDASVPERAIIEIAGWNSGAMATRYAHIRRETKKAALLGLPRLTGIATSTAALPGTQPQTSSTRATSEPVFSTATMFRSLPLK